MPNGDHPADVRSVRDPTSRRWLLPIVAIVILGSAFIAYVVQDHDDAAATAPGDVTRQARSFPTTTQTDMKSEFVSRLEEILAIRTRAYHERDIGILRRIYTVDCPCLTSDSNAIRELIREKYVWVGGETSLRVRRTERVTARMWIIVADFSSAPLRIETKSGRLVRKEPKGEDLFQFVLVRPTGSTQWLLGRASSYEDG
jgi:hypothetical protein